MIIKSLLDTDLYKINMLRVYFHRFSNRMGKFTFKCRNKDVVFTPSMLKRINEEIDSLCSLKFKEEEIQYIGNLSWMKKSIGFLEFLRLFQFNRNYIDVQLNQLFVYVSDRFLGLCFYHAAPDVQYVHFLE